MARWLSWRMTVGVIDAEIGERCAVDLGICVHIEAGDAALGAARGTQPYAHRLNSGAFSFHDADDCVLGCVLAPSDKPKCVGLSLRVSTKEHSLDSAVHSEFEACKFTGPGLEADSGDDAIA
eukprot:CAMPEP_0119428234 /NCGR_PEP_ID=MMETSP1335-20130426/40101_1 /TAXON_ID=259385 /ORGANISM="Chrysoculter rhomboideus, Strain RCC1486" /LENGTH=121 /DNA_ID=CAMNT_0007453909 /DNA_START=132 /DNA_END=495 /DNA_ORIENTATION=-